MGPVRPIVLVLGAVLIARAAAAEPAIERETLVGGLGYDQLADVAVRADGTLLAAGSTFISGSVHQRAWVVGFDAAGAPAGELIFDSHPRSKARAIAPLADGAALIAGAYWEDPDGPALAMLARVERDGRVAWVRGHGGAGDDEALDLVARGDGGAVAVGRTTETEGEEARAWVFAVDGGGARLWETVLDGAVARAIAVLPDGDLAVAGEGMGQGADFWVARLDPSGAPRWQRTYGGGDHDSAYALAARADGSIVVVGETLSAPRGGVQAWVLALDGDGEVLWDRAYGRAGTDRFNAVATNGGALALVGSTQLPGTDDFDLWLVTAGVDGAPTGEAMVGSNRDDRGLGVAALPGGGFAVVGTAQPADAAALVARGRLLIVDRP